MVNEEKNMMVGSLLRGVRVFSEMLMVDVLFPPHAGQMGSTTVNDTATHEGMPRKNGETAILHRGSELNLAVFKKIVTVLH